MITTIRTTPNLDCGKRGGSPVRSAQHVETTRLQRFAQDVATSAAVAPWSLSGNHCRCGSGLSWTSGAPAFRLASSYSSLVAVSHVCFAELNLLRVAARGEHASKQSGEFAQVDPVRSSLDSQFLETLSASGAPVIEPR
jgi:hypothetical protein